MALGNTSGSALIKSAASVASTIANYKDQMNALQWNSSAQTEADFQTYQTYLSTRITNLGSTGTLANSSKALSLTSTLQSANRSYVSNTIQRSSQAIFEGGGTATDKLATIDSLYYQAVANGDQNLAQNLVSQHDSLSQQIQYDAVTAQKAGSDLYKANNIAQEQGYTDAATAIQQAVDQFGQGYSKVGQAHVTQDLGNFGDTIRQISKTMGIDIPAGASPNDGSLITAAFQTMGALYGKAGDLASVTPGGSSSVAGYQTKIDGIINGTTHMSVGGLSMNYSDAQYWALHPESVYQTTTGTDMQGRPQYGLAKAAVDGYKFDQTGTVQPVFAKNGDSTYALADNNTQKQMKADLTAAGFSVTDKNGQLLATPSTDGKNAFFNNATANMGLDANTSFIVHSTATGYQFLATDKNGQDQLLNLAKDNTGKFGIYHQSFDVASNSQTYNLIGKFDGYNAINNSVVTNDPLSSVNGALGRAFSNYATMSKGATEATIIPAIAAKYFNGDTSAAATAVYDYRKPLEVVTNAPAINAGVNVAKPLATAAISIPGSTNLGATINIPGSSNNNGDIVTALQSQFANYAQKASGYAESTIIPTIAKQFFGGDVTKAAASVYKYRQNSGLEAVSKGVPTAVPAQKAAVAPAPAPAPRAAPQPASNFGQIRLPTAQPAQPSVNDAIKAAFSNYKNQAAGYTEKTVLPQIANQYFGGNIKAASTPVYQYRAATFGS